MRPNPAARRSASSADVFRGLHGWAGEGMLLKALVKMAIGQAARQLRLRVKFPQYKVGLWLISSCRWAAAEFLDRLRVLTLDVQGITQKLAAASWKGPCAFRNLPMFLIMPLAKVSGQELDHEPWAIFFHRWILETKIGIWWTNLPAKLLYI